MWGVTAELERRQVAASYWTIFLWHHLLLSYCRDDVLLYERCCENSNHGLLYPLVCVCVCIMDAHSHLHISHLFAFRLFYLSRLYAEFTCFKNATWAHLTITQRLPVHCDFMACLKVWSLRSEKQYCHLMAKLFSKQSNHFSSHALKSTWTETGRI